MIKRITEDSLQFAKKNAEREKLYFTTKNVEYFGYFIGDKLVGFVGIKYYKNKAVLMNDYVLPEYRRQGIYTKLYHYRSDILRKGKYKVEANVTDIILPFHIKNGAKIIKKYKICTKIVYENLCEM